MLYLTSLPLRLHTLVIIYSLSYRTLIRASHHSYIAISPLRFNSDTTLLQFYIHSLTTPSSFSNHSVIIHYNSFTVLQLYPLLTNAVIPYLHYSSLKPNARLISITLNHSSAITAL